MANSRRHTVPLTWFTVGYSLVTTVNGLPTYVIGALPYRALSPLGARRRFLDKFPFSKVLFVHPGRVLTSASGQILSSLDDTIANDIEEEFANFAH